ncbi:hypothetical protein NCCP2716_29230 [Sporosarcina sp. NCCP-2716]|uniref:hypothetical protein n=1 Tax=Sporosarcina sp. NCCP-2716 TaxID=2943679 RepID=UPI00203BA1D6|nr:hypothetical protein [Sporosarcina sp. NCCP-2716]GKV70425.1 hypothetical protein NCCP2716_29230 [Sporosarcina sp. NCCP-2716]
MGFSKLAWVEGKKLFSQRELYIALFLCTLLFVMNVNALPDSPQSVVFWQEMASVMPYFGYMMIAIIVVVGVSRCMPFEREQEMEEVLVTYKGGRVQLLAVKQFVLFFFCVSIVLFYYGIASIVLLAYASPTGLFTQMGESAPNYLSPNPNWTFAKLMLLEGGYMVVASYIFALFVFLLSLFIKRSVFIMLTAGGIFALGELYEKYIFYYIQTMSGIDYLVYGYTYGLNGIMSFGYLERYVVFSNREVLLLFLCLAAGLFVVNLLLGRRRIRVALGN